MERRKLLVTGCARSGTLYAAQVWKAVGLDVRHEMPVPPHGSMGEDGMASWYMAVDDPHPPYGPSAIGYEFDLVVHQVRHPLKVIPSVAQFILRNPPSRRYIERNAPQTRLSLAERLAAGGRKSRLLLQAIRYWYHWNLLAQEKAGETIQVEGLLPALPRLCERLGVEFRPGAANGVSTTLNPLDWYVQEPPWTVSWEDLEGLDPDLQRKVRDLARSYGYD